MATDQHNASPPNDESEAHLLAALEDIEADNKSRVAAIKTKLNKIRCTSPSNSNLTSSNWSSSKPASGSNKSNPNKNVKFHYCNKMGHYQLVCNSRKPDGTPMVGKDGTLDSMGPNATMDMSGLAQAAAPLQYTTPGPSPYKLRYYQNPTPVFQSTVCLKLCSHTAS
jgi:hypothetical protein